MQPIYVSQYEGGVCILPMPTAAIPQTHWRNVTVSFNISSFFEDILL